MDGHETHQHTHIDPEAIRMLREVDPDSEPSLVDSLISVFLQDTNNRLRAMETAIAENRGKETERAAHALRGSCGHFGAYRLLELCGAIERAGAEDRIDQAAELFPSLRAEAEMVAEELTRELHGDALHNNHRGCGQR